MHTTIRAGAPTDAADLADLAARTFRDTFDTSAPPEDMALHLAQAYGPIQQARELADPDITTLVVDADGQLAGYAQLKRGPAPSCVTGDAPVELWRFYLDREWHGQGLAQMLMQRVNEEAHRAQAQTLWLGVWEHNARAQAFYRKCRFTQVGSHVFMVGTDAQTDHILARPVE
jgi:ribosomal protein S18 acetylase RimI-like enzyme